MTEKSKRAMILSVGTALVAGCTTFGGEQTRQRETKQTENPNRPSNCALHHELISDDSASYESENITYEELSPNAKYLFEQAVTNDGYVTKNESRDPPEFDYDDTPARYKIHRNGTTYTLITYSGSGC